MTCMDQLVIFIMGIVIKVRWGGGGGGGGGRGYMVKVECW